MFSFCMGEIMTEKTCAGNYLKYPPCAALIWFVTFEILGAIYTFSSKFAMRAIYATKMSFVLYLLFVS